LGSVVERGIISKNYDGEPMKLWQTMLAYIAMIGVVNGFTLINNFSALSVEYHSELTYAVFLSLIGASAIMAIKLGALILSRLHTTTPEKT
jgi:hypothetical protein